MKRIVAGVMAFIMMISVLPMGVTKAKTEDIDLIDAMQYEYKDASDIETDAEDPTASDLNKSKFGSKKDGYYFSVGVAQMKASVNGTDLKGLEWCQNDNNAVAAEYEKDGVPVVEPVMKATKKNLWTKNTTPYFEIVFPAKEYSNIVFSAYVGASKKGPRDYQLSYAIGESTEFTKLTDTTASISLKKNKVMTKISAKLPEAANRQENIKVRINVASMLIVDCTEDAPVYLYDNPTKGEVAVNHISISGDYMYCNGVKKPEAEEKITVKKAVIKKLKRTKKKVTIQVKKLTNVTGYQYAVGSNKKMTKNKVTKNSKKPKLSIKNKKWKTKKCYVKVRAYKLNSKGKKVFGKWSEIKRA